MTDKLERLARIMSEAIEHGERPDEGHIEDLIYLAPALIAVARWLDRAASGHDPRCECEGCYLASQVEAATAEVLP